MSGDQIDIGPNEMLSVREAPDGPYIVLYPLEWGRPGYGSVYRVVIERQPDSRWRATVPLMPQIVAEADTYDDAKDGLAQTVRAYLRKRIGYIRSAAPLVDRYLRPDPTQPGAAHMLIAGTPIWQLIRDTGEAFVASARGDDTPLMAPDVVAQIAERYDLPDEGVRAALAFYLDHKADIRNEIIHGNLGRADEAFARLQAAGGLTEDELAAALGSSSDI